MESPENEVVSSDLAYWQATTRPLASLLFVLPMLAIYEFGVLLLGTGAIRNGVDVWLRQFLQLLGFGQYFLLPLLTVAILLSWHHLKAYPWRADLWLMPAMLVESMLLGMILLALAHLQASLMQLQIAPVASVEIDTTAKQVIAYFGAGIYEEMFFRLMLIPVLITMFRAFAFPHTAAVILAITASSLLFALAHYNLFAEGAEPIDAYSFTFRAGAGLIFSAIFALRGFGIAVGSHAVYDVLVALS